MKKIIIPFLFIAAFYNSNAQVGIGTTSPEAALDIKSTNSGFLPPRVALVSSTDITSVINPKVGSTSLAEGTMVYNTANGTGVTPGYYYWNGTSWVRISASANQWLFAGNAGTNPSTNFIGTTDNNDFVTRTNNTEKMRVTTAGTIGIGTQTPNGILDMSSISTYGFLPPKVFLTDVTVQAPVLNPQGGNLLTGTMVYNKGTSGVSPGYYYWDNYYNKWIAMGQQIGDIKYGFQTADHGGWILLNGRAKTSLTANQQAFATSLGILANLPNMADRTIVGVSGTKLLNVPGGNTNASVTIAQNQLPNVTLSTDSKGDHNHSTNVTTGILGSISGIPATNIVGNGSSVFGNLATTNAGAHTHTTSSINGDTPQQTLNIQDPYIPMNTFIYLGN